MSAINKYILVIGCFDTKEDVFSHLYASIRSHGEQVITINTGVLGSTKRFPIDFEADNVAMEGGIDIARLRDERNRGMAMEIMGKGAANIVQALTAEGKVKAAIGMGGSGGTHMILSAMTRIPLGIPKLCLTTAAAKDLSRQIGDKDITLMPSVVDVAGLNSIIIPLIEQAAAALCAMSNVRVSSKAKGKGSVAISMFGNTTACVDRCTQLLHAEGYEVFPFHANGVGGKTMEALIREGCFNALLDITTTELADDLCRGVCSAGPDRMNAAAEMGLPQVIAPGCLDMVNFYHPDTVPKKYKNRKFYNWSPDVTLMRTDQRENTILGKQLAEKVNRSSGQAMIILPLKGISQIDVKGGPFYDPDADLALFDSIKNYKNKGLQIIEVDANINDAIFAETLVKNLLDLIQNKK